MSNHSTPKFADGDLVKHSEIFNCCGYIQAWDLHPKLGSIYKVFDGTETSWHEESALKPVTMLFCPLNLKWLIAGLK